MLERLEDLKAMWRKNGYPELEIGIGINEFIQSLPIVRRNILDICLVF